MRVDVNIAGAVVFVTVTGAWDLKDHMAAHQEVVAACRKNKLRHVLVDAKALNPTQHPSIWDTFELITALPASCGHDACFALVFKHHDINSSHIEFAQAVAANRGITLRCFLNTGEAMSWFDEIAPPGNHTPSKNTGR